MNSEVFAIGNEAVQPDIHCEAPANAPIWTHSGSGGLVQDNNVMVCYGETNYNEHSDDCWILNSNKIIHLEDGNPFGRVRSASVVVNRKVSTYIFTLQVKLL